MLQNFRIALRANRSNKEHPGRQNARGLTYEGGKLTKYYFIDHVYFMTREFIESEAELLGCVF
jgi:hypothetical protein